MATGKRYSKAEKEAIMHYRQSHTYQETADKFSVSQMTLARWAKKYRDKTVKGDRFSGDPKYHSLLQVLRYLQGVKGVAVFSEMTMGEPVASICEQSISEDVLAMSMMALLSGTARATDDLDLGSLNVVLTKNKKGYLLIRGISVDLLIIILFDQSTNFASIISEDFSFIDRVGADICQLYEENK